MEATQRNRVRIWLMSGVLIGVLAVTIGFSSASRSHADVIAEYGSHVVTGSEFKTYMQFLRFMKEDISGYLNMNFLLSGKVKEYVASRLAYDQASEEEKAIALQQAEQTWNARREQLEQQATGSARSELSKLGLTEQDVIAGLAMQKIVQLRMDKQITEEHIRQYYESQRRASPAAYLRATVRAIYVGESMGEPGQRTLEEAKAMAMQISSRLKHGEAFTSLFSTYNEDEELRKKGGVWRQEEAVDTLPMAVQQMIGTLPADGTISEPMPADGGTGYFVVVIDHARVLTLEEARPAIKELLIRNNKIQYENYTIMEQVKSLYVPFTDFKVNSKT